MRSLCAFVCAFAVLSSALLFVSASDSSSFSRPSESHSHSHSHPRSEESVFHQAFQASKQFDDSNAVTQWTCETLSSNTVTPGVTWSRLNCSSPSIPFFGPAGPMVFNVVEADLTVPGLRLYPAQAKTSQYALAPLNDIANSTGKTVIAGINGGYFWRLDSASFVDGVCMGKTRQNASEPPSSDPALRNLGTGDGTLITDGEYLSSNCNCTGYNRPVVLSIPAAAAPSIAILDEGAANPNVENALGAGPNLLSDGAVNIPKDDQNIGNILEHAANTGFGLKNGATQVFMVTSDGYDGCSIFDPTCGLNAFKLAYFFKDYLKVDNAMGMDQGGSTTMYVNGFGTDGIVSNSGGSPRAVFDGLFIIQEQNIADE